MRILETEKMVKKMGLYKSTQIVASVTTAPQDVLIEKLEKFTIHYGERERASPQYESAAIQKSFIVKEECRCKRGMPN